MPVASRASGSVGAPLPPPTARRNQTKQVFHKGEDLR